MGTLDTSLNGGVIAKSVTYNPTTAGDQATPIVPAVAGKKIRIFAISCNTNIGGSNFYIRNGAGGTMVTEQFYRAISGSPSAAYYSRVGYDGIFLYESDVGKSLVLNCTTASAIVSVSLTYSYV